MEAQRTTVLGRNTENAGSTFDNFIILMHTGLLFHKRHLYPQQSDHSRWPYRFNAVLLKEDFQGERELSPWSSD